MGDHYSLFLNGQDLEPGGITRRFDPDQPLALASPSTASRGGSTPTARQLPDQIHLSQDTSVAVAGEGYGGVALGEPGSAYLPSASGFS